MLFLNPIAFGADAAGFCCLKKKESLKFCAKEDRGPLKDLKPGSNIIRFAFWKLPPKITMDEQLEEAGQRLETEGLNRGPGGGVGLWGQILEVSDGPT